jgi:hypothetical protein
MVTKQAACSYRIREEIVPKMYVRPARLSGKNTASKFKRIGCSTTSLVWLMKNNSL